MKCEEAALYKFTHLLLHLGIYLSCAELHLNRKAFDLSSSVTESSTRAAFLVLQMAKLRILILASRIQACATLQSWSRHGPRNRKASLLKIFRFGELQSNPARYPIYYPIGECCECWSSSILPPFPPSRTEIKDKISQVKAPSPHMPVSSTLDQSQINWTPRLPGRF
mmetsp:Transcript_12476/g.24205  ORF Transcript_12476/g.24205 Transcript_12476/m.24205 type:complete len:167 (-) Transcript_12476:150-650(-)